MPTARWDDPSQLKGYLEEEERVALEPLLGMALYEHLCLEYERLIGIYADITSLTITPTKKAKDDPGPTYTDVTERLDSIHSGEAESPCAMCEDSMTDVPEEDMASIQLIRICQQIEFYRMISHKAGLLTVSFNEGGGMNMVTADGYDSTDEKRMERVVKDAFMSAGRSIDSLLLFLEADAKGKKHFTQLWQQADAYYLHKDLLFQTARILNEYLDIKGERMAYVALVRDIRFCQNTYLQPRIGAKLLKAIVTYANDGITGDQNGNQNKNENENQNESGNRSEYFDELLSLLRTALAFYVECRRTDLAPVKEKLARRDSMTDAQQAMAAACDYIGENLDALGDAAVGTPIYNAIRAREEQAAKDAADAEAARRRQCKKAMEQSRRKLFTAFPATHRTPEFK